MLDYWEAELGRTLMSVAPPDWQRLDLRATLVHATEDERATAVLADDSIVPLEWPATGIVTVNELRNAQWEADTGTFVALRMLLDPSGSYRVYYDFELSPDWDPPVAAADYIEDRNPFPRKPEYVPGWWDGREPDFGDRERILTRITSRLKFDLPANVAEVRLTATAGKPATARVRTIGGADQAWAPPPFLDELLRHHRDLGEPWESAVIEFEHGGQLRAGFTP